MEWYDQYSGHQINEGAFGIIYELTGRPNLVLKALNLQLESREDRLRMQREIEILKNLSGHPNIIPIYEHDLEANHPWYVMPKAYMNLFDYVKEKGKLDEDTTIHFALQILAGLQKAHKKGVLHRDLGPHNILLYEVPDSKLPNVWIADFGLGRDYNISTKTLTRSIDTQLGHSSFISHEQYDALSNASVQSDLYSVGALMVYMCTGKDPLRNKIDDSGLGAITLELMQYEPSRRTQDAKTAINYLKQYKLNRNPNRIPSTPVEIASSFARERKLTQEQASDLTKYLTRKNRLYGGSDQASLIYSSYFIPLLELPPELIRYWASNVASPDSILLFLERYQEQVYYLALQKGWSRHFRKGICRFIMTLFDDDNLKGKITSIIAFALVNNFVEAYEHLTDIVTTQYTNGRVIMAIAEEIAKHKDTQSMKAFIDENLDQIKHIPFLDGYNH